MIKVIYGGINGNAFKMKPTKRIALDIKNAGFLLMLLIPALGPIGYYVGVIWLSPVVIFVVVPILDWMIGEDQTNSANVLGGAVWDICLYLVPIFYVIAWLFSLMWTAWLASSRTLSYADLMAMMVAASAGSSFATCAAHELLHRRNRFDKFLSRIAMAMCCYGHFVVEHIHHHRTAGIFEAGTLPYKGESLYKFVIRNMHFGFGNAYRIEESRRKAKKLAFWQNLVVQQHFLSFGFAVAFFAVWGGMGLIVFGYQAFVAMASVELIQYFEHYGLQRMPGQPITSRESWNSNGWLTNALTLNITRHSHHHTNITVPYQHLNMLPGVPTMPFGYFGLAWLALVPALWRKVIDFRIKDA